MRKLVLSLFLIISLFAALAVPSVAIADWSVTVTWQRSPSAELDFEQVFLDDTSKCTIQETETTTCNFVVQFLNGQEVKVRSTNTQGAFADYVIGNLLSVPTPATGGTITITIVP